MDEKSLPPLFPIGERVGQWLHKTGAVGYNLVTTFYEQYNTFTSGPLGMLKVYLLWLTGMGFCATVLILLTFISMYKPGV